MSVRRTTSADTAARFLGLRTRTQPAGPDTPMAQANRAIQVPDYVTTPERIMQLFVADDIVLRPSEIMRRTGRGEESVRASLQRLVNRGRLFHLAHSQYARVATAKTLDRVRADRIGRLEGRLAELEEKLANLWAQVLP